MSKIERTLGIVASCITIVTCFGPFWTAKGAIPLQYIPSLSLRILTAVFLILSGAWTFTLLSRFAVRHLQMPEQGAETTGSLLYCTYIFAVFDALMVRPLNFQDGRSLVLFLGGTVLILPLSYVYDTIGERVVLHVFDSSTVKFMLLFFMLFMVTHIQFA